MTTPPVRFMTDLGGPLVLTRTPDDESPPVTIGRYGVWEVLPGRKPVVVATGDNLDALQQEYGPGLSFRILTNYP